MLTARDIYERVSNHLLTQRAVSEDENGSCRLRSGNGRKCAIGSLIADELYRPEIEGIGISYYRHAKDGSLLRALYASEVNAYDPDIVELLIPELQRRGLFKKEYRSGTLREKLFAKGPRLGTTHPAHAYRTWAQVPA